MGVRLPGSSRRCGTAGPDPLTASTGGSLFTAVGEAERMTDGDEMEAVARAAVSAGGAELRARYRNGDTGGEYGTDDVKAAADGAAEARMLPVVRQAFPDHAVLAEEAGEFPGSDPYRWIVDPLDGTNDFAAGLPTFASSAADSDAEPAAATVTTIVGRGVPRDPDLARRAEAIRESLRGTVKRAIPSWAPTVHSALFARGRIRGLVQFRPDEEEQTVTELFASEAGTATRRDGSLYVAAGDEATLSTLWDAVRDDPRG